jgi:hypothetical protein
VDVGPSNGNKVWVESGFELAVNSKTDNELFFNLAWDPP